MAEETGYERQLQLALDEATRRLHETGVPFVAKRNKSGAYDTHILVASYARLVGFLPPSELSKSLDQVRYLLCFLRGDGTVVARHPSLSVPLMSMTTTGDWNAADLSVAFDDMLNRRVDEITMALLVSFPGTARALDGDNTLVVEPLSASK